MIERIQKALREWLRTVLKKQSFHATVLSVNETEFTCNVEPVDGGAEYHEVRLKPVIDNDDHGIIAIPEVGSIVTVSICDNNDQYAYVTQASKAKKIIIKSKDGIYVELTDVMKLNGDAHGGLTKVQELVTKLNNIESAVNSLKSTFNSHSHTSNGTPTATQSNVNLTQTAASDLENTKVKHGS